MQHLNVEIKARCNTHYRIRNALKECLADYKGIDHQTDTYFNVGHGRLKLREGNIENYLVYYERENQEGPKKSKVILYKNEPGSELKNILTTSLGVLTVVEKSREIYFVENVKIHLDYVNNLGTFVEIEAIEAIDDNGPMGIEKLEYQCREFMNLFGIKDENLIKDSYSDLLLAKQIEK